MDSCGRDEAWIQLSKAIADGVVPNRWADVSLGADTGGGHYVEHYADEEDVPPTSRWFWASACYRFSGGGRVLDDPALDLKRFKLKLARTGDLEFRPLLVLREAVDAIWPVASNTIADVEPAVSRLDKTAGRPTNRDLVRKTLSAMRDERCSMDLPQKALAEQIVRRNNQQFGARGWSERAVLKHVSDWLKENSLSPTVKPRLRK